MPVYRCFRCAVNREYETKPTGAARRCPDCGKRMARVRSGLGEEPDQREKPDAADGNRAKTMAIFGQGVPVVLFVPSVLFGFILQHITLGVGTRRDYSGEFLENGPLWFTFTGQDAVLLGFAGTSLALGMHLEYYWFLVTGRRYQKHLGLAFRIIAGVCALAMLYVKVYSYR